MASASFAVSVGVHGVFIRLLQREEIVGENGLAGQAVKCFSFTDRSRSGQGKTHLLTTIAKLLGRHVPYLWVEFHGPAIDELLVAHADGKCKVVLIEPWSDPVIGWNPLAVNQGESPYTVVQELIAVFRDRIWSDSWGARLEEVLRMTLIALVEADLTLLEVTPFLTRPDFRRAVLRFVTTPEVRDFWILRFEQTSPAQRSQVIQPVLNKVSIFHDPVLKYVVGQQHATLHFDRALKEGHIILVNLSSGRLHGNNYLLASLLIAAFKNAVYRRPTDPPAYAALLDEFQEFSGLGLWDDFLRSFRKFGCSVFMGTQHLDLPASLKSAIFANCSEFYAFAGSASDASVFAKEFGGPEAALIAEMLPELKRGQAIVKQRGEPARLLHVVPPASGPSGHQVEAARGRCLRLGASRADIDKEIVRRQSALFRQERTAKQQVADSLDGEEASLPEGYDGL